MSFGPPPPPSAWTHSAMTQISRRKRKHSRVVGIFVALAVIVAASVAGVWFTLARTDTQPTGGEKSPQAVRQLPGDVAESVERAPADLAADSLVFHKFDDTPKGEISGSYGTWLTKKSMARARIDGNDAYIEGYRLQRTDMWLHKWKIPLGRGLCGTTRHVTVDGRTALITEYAGPNGEQICGRLVVVDLNRGKLLWDKKIPNTVANANTSWGLSLSQNVAAISWAGGSAAYDLTSRKLLWSDTQASKCTVEGFAGGRQLLAVVGCVVAGSDRKDLKVAKVDPRSGKHLWDYSPGSFGHSMIQIVSTQPAVLAVSTVNDGTFSHLIALNESGKRRSTIPVNADIQALSCPNDVVNLHRLDRCRGITVSNKFVFLTSSISVDQDQPTNSIAAYDLNTGKGVARFDSPDAGGTLSVFQANGDHALALQEGASYDASPYVLYELQVKGEKRIPFMFFTNEDKLDPTNTQQDFLFHHGILAIGDPIIKRGQTGELALISRTRYSKMPIIKSSKPSDL